MEGMQILFGFGVGGAIGAVAGWFIAASRAAARSAAGEAALAELAGVRRDSDVQRNEAAKARQEEASARASLAAAERSATELRQMAQKERDRAEEQSRQRSDVERRLAEIQTRLAEREANLAEQRTLLDRAQEALKDAFKSTGADVLRSTADEFMRRAREQQENQQKLGQQDLDARQKAIDATLAPLREQLVKQEELVKQLGEKREGDAKSLGEQLRQIAELQQKASAAAQTLSSALRDNRQRGQWGELSLRNIAELAGLSENVDYSEQSSVEGDEGNRLRPDMTVRLPGSRFVPIDAKVPLLAYLDSLEASATEADRLARRRAHAQALRTHVRALAGRDYARALGGGVEITVLFVPLESALIAALEEAPDVYKEAIESRVIICTASTLLALLRTCALQWQQAHLNENARRIGDNAKVMLDRVATFAEHLDRVGSGLSGAVKGYNAAVGSFNSRLLPSARDTAKLAGSLDRMSEDLETVDPNLREVAGAAPALPEA